MSFDRTRQSNRLLDALRTGRFNDATPGTVTPTDERQEEGILSRASRFLFDPLIDVPELPGGALGDIVEEGIESVVSPVGLAATLLVPFTGGTSLGATGALSGIALRGATRVGAEVALGGATGVASKRAAELLEDKGPIASLAAGVLAGGLTAGGAMKLMRTVAPAAVNSSTAAAMDVLEKTRDLTRSAQEIQDPVQKLAFVTRNAKELTEANQFVKSQQLGAKFEQFENLRADLGGGSDEFRQAFSTLGGELSKARFEAPEGFLTKEDFEAVWKIVDDRMRVFGGPDLPGETIEAYRGLMKVFYDGAIPAPAEMKRLRSIFGDELADAIESQRTLGEKARQTIMSTLNLPRTIMASVDMSAPLRQGAMLIGRPREFFGAFKPMVNAWGDREFAERTLRDLIEDPTILPGWNDSIGILMKKAKLEMTTLGGALADREEFMMGQFIGPMKSSLAGRSIKASEQAYTMFLNKLRHDTFVSFLKKQNPDTITIKDMRAYAQHLNYVTGRGKLPKGLNSSSPLLNAFFFAPKLLLSRLSAPTSLFTASDVARREIAQDLGRFVGAGIATLALIKYSGAGTVEVNPLSSDFGKGRIGNTRFDIWAGYQPIARYAAQLTMGKRKTLDGMMRDANRLSVLGRFAQTKLAPVPGAAIDLLRGETFMGDELGANADSFSEVLGTRLAPLFIQDMIEGVREEGVIGAASVLPAFFGVGVGTFSTLRETQNRVAQEQFNVDYRDATGTQQQFVRNHPDVLAKLEQLAGKAGNDFGEAIDETENDRITGEQVAMAAYSSGRLSPKDFADALEDVNNRAAIRRETHAQDFGIQSAPPGSPLQLALEGFRDLYRQADIGFEAGVRTGNIDWELFDQLERDYMAELSEAQRNHVEQRSRLSHDESVQWYYDAKQRISDSGYYDFNDEVFARFRTKVGRVDPNIDSFSQLVRTKNLADREGNTRLSEKLSKLIQQIQNEVAKRRLKLRKKNPQLDIDLFTIGRVTTLVSN